MSGRLEGRRPVLEALRAGREIREILLAAGMRPSPIVDEIRHLAAGREIPVRTLPRRELDRRAEGSATQGVVALVAGFTYATLDDLLERARSGDEPVLIVALDGVTDPHNLGAVARSAEAAGAHGIVVPERRSAHVTPVVEKAAAGALAHLPVALVENLARALDRLRGEGVWVVALDAGGEASLWELSVATEDVCLVVGAEGRGVSRLVRERADVRCRIPLAGRVSSLNASAAGAVALFEVRRRRATWLG